MHASPQDRTDDERQHVSVGDLLGVVQARTLLHAHLILLRKALQPDFGAHLGCFVIEPHTIATSSQKLPKKGALSS